MHHVILGALLGTADAARLEISRPTLCALAEAVVVGEVTGQASMWSTGELGGIETWSDLILDPAPLIDHPTLAGKALLPEVDTVAVFTPGGAHGGLRLRIEDAAVLRTDRRYLLLLTPIEGGWRVVGGEDGAIPLPHGSSGALTEALESLGECHAD